MPLHHTVEDNVVQTHHIDIDAGSVATTSFPELPQDALLTTIAVIPFTAFDTAATVDIGTSGDTDEFAASSEFDLTFASPQVFDCYKLMAAATTPVVTFNANSATSGDARIMISYVVS